MPAPRPKLTRGPLAQRALLGKQCPTYASASHKPRARSLLFKFAKAPCQDKIPKASARYIITVGLFSHIKEPFFVFARERLVGVAGKLRDLHGKGCGGGPVLSARRHKHPAPRAGRGTGTGTAGLVPRGTASLMMAPTSCWWWQSLGTKWV